MKILLVGSQFETFRILETDVAIVRTTVDRADSIILDLYKLANILLINAFNLGSLLLYL